MVYVVQFLVDTDKCFPKMVVVTIHTFISSVDILEGRDMLQYSYSRNLQCPPSKIDCKGRKSKRNSKAYLKGLFTMIKWDLSLGCKDGQPMQINLIDHTSKMKEKPRDYLS